ncbi:hypothetical protein Ssi03_23120 [Sphaerisporangium siamense]|nr:hypothetical protein Ssi03_23120 [Sphaerisporangium siamense]
MVTRPTPTLPPLPRRTTQETAMPTTNPPAVTHPTSTASGLPLLPRRPAQEAGMPAAEAPVVTSPAPPVPEPSVPLPPVVPGFRVPGVPLSRVRVAGPLERGGHG